MSRRRRRTQGGAAQAELVEHEPEPTCHGLVLTRLDGEWRLIEVSLTEEQLEAVETKRHKADLRGMLIERGYQVLLDIVRRARERR